MDYEKILYETIAIWFTSGFVGGMLGVAVYRFFVKADKDNGS